MPKRLTVAEVRQVLKRVTSTGDPVFRRFNRDPRSGVQAALLACRRRVRRLRRRRASFWDRLKYEHGLWRRGDRLVAGVDEVGYGPLAGPVVAGAVILPHRFNLLRVNDSKQLTPHEREKLAPLILDRAVDFSLGIGSNRLIDRVNIYEADLLAMRRAVAGLAVRPDYLIVDGGRHVRTRIPQLDIYHGDARSVSVGAASIIAKVYRDRLMDKYDRVYPQYDFRHNAGYGTAQHLAALRKYGITPIHRKSFKPVRRAMK